MNAAAIYDRSQNDGPNFQWKEVSVSVSRKDESYLSRACRRIRGNERVESTDILKGVSGHAEEGNMVAIIGPSGAGKTTLLASLARRVKLTSGSVRINGLPATREIMSEISGYMPQFDALPSKLTAKEYMLFTCTLKLDRRNDANRRRTLAEKLLTDLGLHDCRDTMICGLSGGQRKRLSLAMELITKPKILFLDEPTTGLDTFAATQVIQCIKLITLNGTIVLCTIHQPGMAIYNIFSHVLLMTDGRTAFFGTLENATDFFTSQGFSCPVGYDEVEYYVGLVSHKCTDCLDESFEKTTNNRISGICEAFSKSNYSDIPDVTPGVIAENRQTPPGSLVQFYWIMWRICVRNCRTMFSEWITWGAYLATIAMIAIFYFGVNPRAQSGVQNARGALYMMISEIIFTVAYSVIYEMPSEISIYLRESSMYTAGPYFSATFLGLVPKTLLKALIFSTVLYFVLNPSLTIFTFLLYSLCAAAAAICGTSYGIMVSSWIEDIEIATAIMVPVDMVFLLLAGMFYNLRALPSHLAYLKYFSLFYYANEALAIVFWTQVDKIECDKNGDLPCFSSGSEVLSEFGYSESMFWWDMGGLIALTISMSLIGYIGTRRRQLRNSFY